MTEIYGPATITENRGRGSLEPGTVVPEGMKTVWVNGIEYLTDAHSPCPAQRVLEELMRDL